MREKNIEKSEKWQIIFPETPSKILLHNHETLAGILEEHPSDIVSEIVQFFLALFDASFDRFVPLKCVCNFEMGFTDVPPYETSLESLS